MPYYIKRKLVNYGYGVSHSRTIMCRGLFKPLAWNSDEAMRSKRIVFKHRPEANKQIASLASDTKHEYWVEKLTERDLKLMIDR